MNNNQNHINQSRPHDSAIKHVSGLAEYTDDINEPPGTLLEQLDGVKNQKLL